MSEKDTDIHMINGSKTSGHKPPYELITQTLLRRTAERLRLGAVKHGRWNWKKGAETKEYALDRLSHAFEHVTSAMAKIENDEPIGDDDLAAVVVNCMFAMYYQEWVKGYDTQSDVARPLEWFAVPAKPQFPSNIKLNEGEVPKGFYRCNNCGVQFDHTPLIVTAIAPLANYNDKPAEFYFHNVECQTTWLRNPKY